MVFRLATVGPLIDKLFYFTAPVDQPLPYLEFWTGDGVKDPQAGFGEEAREYHIYLQAAGRKADEASDIYEAAEEALNYLPLTVVGWNQRGRVVWVHELDDPGDITQDDRPTYYEGGAFKVELYRPRPN